MKKNKSTRDYWIAESWRFRGAGPHKNKKKLISRKRKYSKKENKDE